jgi:hypothetical protein
MEDKSDRFVFYEQRLMTEIDWVDDSHVEI